MSESASIDARFSGAWSEATARVIARDAIALGYVAGVATIIGFQKPELALAVPYLTLLVGALVCHHDIVISLLNAEMRTLVPTVPQQSRAAWQHRLIWPVVTGACLVTAPLVLVAAKASQLAVRLAASGSLQEDFNLVNRLSPWAWRCGVVCLCIGRAFQFWNVRSAATTV